jgi:uncharacterized membrane protein
MTTNIQEAPQTKRPDQPVGIEPTPTPTPVANPTGVRGVAVYDRGPDDPSMRPSASILDDAAPMKSQSTGNMIAWIIGIVLLIIIAYLVLQMLF